MKPRALFCPWGIDENTNFEACARLLVEPEELGVVCGWQRDALAAIGLRQDRKIHRNPICTVKIRNGTERPIGVDHIPTDHRLAIRGIEEDRRPHRRWIIAADGE